jgi:hypothetical protein
MTKESGCLKISMVKPGNDDWFRVPDAMQHDVLLRRAGTPVISSG